MKLQEKFPDIEFMTAAECATKLGWTFTEDNNGISDIKCCGQNVAISAFLGVADYAYCPILVSICKI